MIMQKVEVSDLDETGVLALDLRDILRLIGPRPELEWYLLELEAMGRLTGGETILELEKRITESPTGIRMSWTQLSELADQLTQTINATLVAVKPNAALPTLPLKQQPGLEIAIEAIDSTVWAISTNDQNLVGRFQKNFRKTRVQAWAT